MQHYISSPALEGDPLLDAIYRSAEIGMCITDAGGRFVRVNDAYLAIYGFEADEIIGRNFAELVMPTEMRDYANRVHHDYLMGRSEESPGEWHVLRKDGTPLTVFVTATRLVMPDGSRYKVTTVTDMTEPKRQREALEQQTERLWRRDREAYLFRERLRLAQEAAVFGIFDYDVDTGRIAVDAAYRKLYGLPEDVPVSYLEWERHVHPDDLPSVLADLERTIETGEDFKRRFRIRTLRGETRFVQAVASVSDRRGGRPSRLTGINYDVTEEENARRLLERVAYEDRLTGLPNREAAIEMLESEATAHAAGDRWLLVGVLDVVQMRRINRRSGERVGDALLRAVAGRLSSTFPGFVGRLEMDKFVLVHPFDGEADAEAALEAARDGVEKPCSVGGLTIPVSIRAGYCVHAPDDDPNAARDAFESAMLAVDRAKGDRGRAIERYTPAFGEEARRERVLQERLEDAIPNGEFRLVYQPQIDMRTGGVFGVEALLRWHLPGEGAVPPDVFIPLAERNGTILRIGDFVAERAAADVADWSREGVSLSMISINVSPVQIADVGFLDYVDALDRRFATSTSRLKLELELTEPDYIQPSPTNIEKLQAMRARGIGLSIDDFGKGYSSLSYLDRFPVDMIKIDRNFVRTIEEGLYAQKIVRSVKDIAEAIGADMVAEGIETKRQAEIVRGCGCCFGQGYLFSAPLDPERIPAAVERGFADAVPGR